MFCDISLTVSRLASNQQKPETGFEKVLVVPCELKRIFKRVKLVPCRVNVAINVAL